ncbi:MAG TPA: prolipoprotein diacylglyceryl transferase [Candidatus Marinimicrobia bacterium]|nr:prolipoprotein diacylglyceryl transferase [Candidatus Neomarinimicrobiota bacterium]
MHPILFRFNGRPITTYLVLYTIAIIFGIYVIMRLSRKDGLDLQEIFVAALLITLAGKFGAQIYSVILTFFQDISSIKHPAKLYYVFKTGGAFHGAFLFGGLFAYFYLKKIFKENFLKVFDNSFVGFALTQAIGRLGCFSAGCCFGRPTNLPWGMDFPHLGMRIHPMHGVKIHPTQLYESFLDFINFVFLYMLWKRKKFDGQLTAHYLINYGLIRFFVEYFRGDTFGRGYVLHTKSPFLSLSIPQLWSLIMIIGGFYLLKKLSSRVTIKE